MCCFTIDCPASKDETINLLKTAIKSQQEGFFVGDTSSGQFSFLMISSQLIGNYTLEEDKLRISIVKQPWLLSCNTIEAEIRKYLG